MEIGTDHSVNRRKPWMPGTGLSMVAKKLQKTAAIMAAAEPIAHPVVIQNRQARPRGSDSTQGEISKQDVSDEEIQ